MFISNIWEYYESMLDVMIDKDGVVQIAVDFHEHLVNAHQSNEDVDKHLKMIARFILMTNNFRNFVDCYRCQDSAGAEKGHFNFAPVWKMNKQNKYVNCWVDQLFQLNENHVYSLVNELIQNN